MKPTSLGNVGLALSGGGTRAVAFHLGVLKWLDCEGLWSQISYLSTVSGGSLAVGLAFAANGGNWPSTGQFRDVVLPVCREWLTTQSIQTRFVFSCLRRPWELTRGRAHILARTLRQSWSFNQTLQDLPDSPVWRINCTCYESGKNWRFSKEKMGDYVVGYAATPNLQICEAIAASAAVPGLIGPLKLHVKQQTFEQRSFGERMREGSNLKLDKVHLWDGAVYENLGLEPIFKGNRFKHGVDFLIISDASLAVSLELGRQSRAIQLHRPLLRLLDISVDQVRALRARWIVSYFRENPNSGMFLRLGNTPKYIFESANRPVPAEHQSESNRQIIRSLARIQTSLRRMKPTTFDELVEHGFETAESTFAAYHTPSG